MNMNGRIPESIEILGKKFIILEEVDNKFLRACLAEFLAMHLFVLLCCGCAMVTFNLPNPNLMMIAASFGFGILVLAQIFGPLSGGHINNAVSFALFIAGRISLIKMICYTLSQMLGSVFGALFLWAIFGTHWPAARAFGSNSWDESTFTGGQVFFGEMLGTMLLIFNVLSTIDIPKEGGGPLGVYPIAMSVMVAHLFLLPVDGCSINPARSFGPSLVANWAAIPGTYDHQQHVFWFGPLFGAGVAAVLYEYASLKPENFAGAKDMDTALFAANKRKVKKHNKVHKEHHHHNDDVTSTVPETRDIKPAKTYYTPNAVENPLHGSHSAVHPTSHPAASKTQPTMAAKPTPAAAVPDFEGDQEFVDQPAIINPNKPPKTGPKPTKSKPAMKLEEDVHMPPPPPPPAPIPYPETAPPVTPVPPMQFGDGYNEFEEEAL